jgi:hypothetical protein
MKLYTVTLIHRSPKDSESGIDCFLIANNEEQVYDWLRDNRCTGYKDQEKGSESYDIESPVSPWNTIRSGLTFQEKIIYYRGCANDPDTDYEDLYYGQTNWSWNEGQELTEADLSVLQRYLGDKLVDGRGEQ